MVTGESVVRTAEDRVAEKRRTLPFAVGASYVPSLHLILVELNSGYSLSFPPERAQGLGGANDEDLMDIEISSAGYGVHFSRLDADSSIEGFLAGRFGSERWEREWAAKHQKNQAA